MFHEGELRVVLAHRVAGNHIGDNRVDRGAEIPDGIGKDDARITLRVVDQRTDGQDIVFLCAVGGADALTEDDVGAGVDLGDGGFLGLGRIKPGSDEAVEELGVRFDLPHTVAESVDQQVDLRNGISANGTKRV